MNNLPNIVICREWLSTFHFLLYNSEHDRNICALIFDILICHADCTTDNRFLIFVSRWIQLWWSMRHWMLAEACRRTLYIIEIASVVLHLLIYTRSLITNTAWQPHGSPDSTFIQPVSLVDIIDELVSLRRGSVLRNVNTWPKLIENKPFEYLKNLL